MLVKNDPPPKFQLCQLQGGPHDGQTVNVPDDEDTLTFQHAGHPHDYYRLGIKPAFFHESRVSAMFGVGR